MWILFSMQTRSSKSDLLKNSILNLAGRPNEREHSDQEIRSEQTMSARRGRKEAAGAQRTQSEYIRVGTISDRLNVNGKSLPKWLWNYY